MLYLLRHCKAVGQEKEAALTEKGQQKAQTIIPILQQLNIDKIYSSPMTRALKTIEPFASVENKKVHIDERLTERVLTSKQLDSFLPVLQKTFDDYDLKLQGGESSKEAEQRVIKFLNELDLSDNVLIVSHGNLIALVLNYFAEFTFDHWKKLENPDLWVVTDDRSIAKIDLTSVGDKRGN